MCGICGIAYDEGAGRVDPAVLERMTACLAHRGPDDSGAFISPSGAVGLGHRRLAIIDPAGGRQPMSNETGSVHLVCNGEIYNFRQLRDDLVASGHTFATGSDSEVIVHLYEEHGPDCVRLLRGMFAFGLWDEPAGRLLLARDRLGQKPLVWCRQNGMLAFASTVASLRQHPGVGGSIDPNAIHHFLTYQYIPHPLTIYREVSKLPPAHLLVWERGAASIRRYWSPQPRRDDSRGEADWCDELRARLMESVRMRLVSDVPLGAFLSGGLDSSIIVALMSKLCDEPVKTFSIGFGERRYDERAYARAAAERFGTDHREFVVRPNAFEMLPQLVRHYAEPFGDSSAIPTFYLSRVTREQVKVVLTGDAGDELFLGYPRYAAAKLARLVERVGPMRWLLGWRGWRLLPASVEQKTALRRLRKFALAKGPSHRRYYNWIAIFNDAEKEELYEPAFAEQIDADSFGLLRELYEGAGTGDPAAAAAWADMFSYLPGDLLTKVDVATMSVGLEARSPFLDHEFVEFALSVPPGLKLRGLRGKHLLRKAFADLLPPEILRRRKMGFGVPIAAWFRGELADHLRAVLLGHRALERGRFRPETVRRLVEDHIAGRADNAYKLWNLLVLEQWLRANDD